MTKSSDRNFSQKYATEKLQQGHPPNRLCSHGLAYGRASRDCNSGIPKFLNPESRDCRNGSGIADPAWKATVVEDSSRHLQHQTVEFGKGAVLLASGEKRSENT